MDQWKPPDGFFQGAGPMDHSSDGFHRTPNRLSQEVEHENMDSIAARKVQKADREKLRRDKLNEQFLELGKALDPDRPRNDKATILTDTIQMLVDLTAQVNRLKTEYTALSEESVELTQEKNELKEEKATLKSDIENLNAQYQQQRLRCMYPWATMDPSVVMGPPPPTYPFPIPVPIPSGPIASHPSLQPYPFFPNQRPGPMLNPCPAYVPYSSPFNHPQVEQISTQHHISPRIHPSSSRSHSSSRQDSTNKSSEGQKQSGPSEKSDDYSSDVVTELELKTPGSAAPSHSRATCDQGFSSEEMKAKLRNQHTPAPPPW